MTSCGFRITVGHWITRIHQSLWRSLNRNIKVSGFQNLVLIFRFLSSRFSCQLRTTQLTIFEETINVKWSMFYAVKWLDIHQRVKSMIRSVFESAAVVHTEMRNSKSRAIYGVDVMLDSSFQPKLLEVCIFYKLYECGRILTPKLETPSFTMSCPRNHRNIYHDCFSFYPHFIRVPYVFCCCDVGNLLSWLHQSMPVWYRIRSIGWSSQRSWLLQLCVWLSLSKRNCTREPSVMSHMEGSFYYII